MRKTRQTRFGQPGGNCFQACVASVLDVELDLVPDVMNAPGLNEIGDEEVAAMEALRLLHGWSLSTFGLRVAIVPAEYVDEFGFTGIVSGLMSTGSNHSVVYRDGAFWHNPAPGHDVDLAEAHFGIVFYPIRVGSVEDYYPEGVPV